jgi:hypothetical protein
MTDDRQPGVFLFAGPVYVSLFCFIQLYRLAFKSAIDMNAHDLNWYTHYALRTTHYALRMINLLEWPK